MISSQKLGRVMGLARPLLAALDPETAHEFTLAALRRLPALSPEGGDRRLAVEAFGLNFANPIGMAAGFDKGALVPDALLGLGFGFVEIGTVTARPQPGNPRPRLFRLAADGAVVNRFGFNSEGHDAVLARLRARGAAEGIIGVNIGANKDSIDRAADYVAGVKAFAGTASYFAVNVSSPNTPGLRDLQARDALDDLLARVLEAREAMARQGPRRPVLLKISPDASEAELDDIIACVRRRGLDGMIVSNTTVARSGLGRGRPTQEAGGLSGRPLFARSTQVLAQAFLRLDGFCPLIGVGGIDSGESALTKIEAGASLLQIYTGLVFQGPKLIEQIKSRLTEAIQGAGATDLTVFVGRRAAALAMLDL